MMGVSWNHLNAFHATATGGSLSAAARQMGLTQPTLSRQIQALEAELGVTLFERPGRKLVLTQTAKELLGYIETMQEAATALTLAANGQTKDISGRVCISATDSMATYVLPELIGRLKELAPQLTIEIMASNDVSNLHKMEADIALRHARPERHGLVGQHLFDTHAHYYASKDWVARHGLPASLEDLAKANIIGFDDVVRLSGHMRKSGIPIEPDDFRLISNSAVVVWEMVKQGLGVAAMITEVARRTPNVVRLLPDILPPVQVPLWLVTHQALQSSPKIRLVLDVLAENLTKK